MSEQPPPPLRPRLSLENARAVGGPVALPLLASYFGLGLVGWLAAACALMAAAPASGRPSSRSRTPAPRSSSPP